jgi:hypothetical protein
VNSIVLYFINGDTIIMDEEDLKEQDVEVMDNIKDLEEGGEIKVDGELPIKGPPGGFQPGVGDWDKPTDVEMIL